MKRDVTVYGKDYFYLLRRIETSRMKTPGIFYKSSGGDQTTTWSEVSALEDDHGSDR